MIINEKIKTTNLILFVIFSVSNLNKKSEIRNPLSLITNEGVKKAIENKLGNGILLRGWYTEPISEIGDGYASLISKLHVVFVSF